MPERHSIEHVFAYRQRYSIVHPVGHQYVPDPGRRLSQLDGERFAHVLGKCKWIGCCSRRGGRKASAADVIRNCERFSNLIDFERFADRFRHGAVFSESECVRISHGRVPHSNVFAYRPQPAWLHDLRYFGRGHA